MAGQGLLSPNHKSSKLCILCARNPRTPLILLPVSLVRWISSWYPFAYVNIIQCITSLDQRYCIQTVQTMNLRLWIPYTFTDFSLCPSSRTNRRAILWILWIFALQPITHAIHSEFLRLIFIFCCLFPLKTFQKMLWPKEFITLSVSEKVLQHGKCFVGTSKSNSFGIKNIHHFSMHCMRLSPWFSTWVRTSAKYSLGSKL